jgi:hypothetical protein
MTKICYAGYRFPPEIIQRAIWLYYRFTLSFRDVEDLLAERGSARLDPASAIASRATRPGCGKCCSTCLAMQSSSRHQGGYL